MTRIVFHRHMGGFISSASSVGFVRLTGICLGFFVGRFSMVGLYPLVLFRIYQIWQGVFEFDNSLGGRVDSTRVAGD